MPVSSDPAATEDVRTNYGRGRFGGRLGAGRRSALLLVDLCNAYLEPGSPLYAGQSALDAVDACGRLLDAARTHGMVVVHTRIDLSSPTSGGLFVRKVPALELFRTAGPLSSWPSGLEPRPDEEVISKEYASAFFGTALAARLTVLGVDTLVIGGLSTSGCVRATALDAMQSGFAPLVVREACGDRHPEPHESALFDLDSKYADVIALRDALGIVGGDR